MMPKFYKISLLILAAAAVAGCETPDAAAPPFDLRGSQQNERARSSEVAPQPMNPLPTKLESPYLINNNNAQQPTTPPATGPALENDVTIRMPLQEIIQRAVANSYDVKVAGYQPAIDETRVTEAEARFDPTFFANLQFQRVDTQSGFGFSTGNGDVIQQQTGIRQNLQSGGSVSFHYDTNWTQPAKQPQSVFSSATPHQFWANDLTFELTQPLLQNFGNEINTARITINRNNQHISLLDFRKQLEQTASDIEKTYWQLTAAEREVRIDETLLNSTLDTAEVLWKRRQHDVNRVQLSQANASIESRRAILIRAKAHVRDLSDQLKRLMNDPDLPVSSGVLILPADPPAEVPIEFDLKDQIDTALENRFELGEQQLKIDSADVALKVADNNLLPSLNAVGSISLQGEDTGLHDTIKEQSQTTELNYSIGLQFEIPIGNREARAIYRRAQLQRDQAIAQYEGLTEQVALDVKTALREVHTTWEEMSANRQARFAANDALLAIQQREEGGEALTPEFVQLKLDRQESLAQSATSEAEAISNYNIAISQLELKKGTLLRYNNILMQEEDLPVGYKP